jgi:hypothetical protein
VRCSEALGGTPSLDSGTPFRPLLDTDTLPEGLGRPLQGQKGHGCIVRIQQAIQG